MSTQNFYYNNVLYAVDDQGDEFIYEDTRDNILSELAKHGITDNYGTDVEENRSYSSEVIATLRVKDTSKSSYYIQVVARGGYYGGFNLDYNVIQDHYEDGTYVNDEVDASKYVQQLIDRKARAVCRIFNKYSEKLTRVAVFSNGEAMYKRI